MVLPRPMASPLLSPADVPMHSPRELAAVRADAQAALRRVYDLHTGHTGQLGLLAPACVEGCPGRWPCATRRVAAEALGLPEGNRP